MRIPFFAAIFLLAVTYLPAQQFPSSAGRKSDLDFVATTIPARHPNFYNQLNRTSYQQAVAELSARLTTATDAEFYVGLARLVAMAGDAHTALNYNNAPFRVFPLRFRWFDDGVFVTRATSQYAETLGTRLIRIGETPIDEAMRQVATVIPHENDPWLQAQIPGYLINQTILQGLGIAGPQPESSLTFRRLDGREFTLKVDTGGDTFISAIPEAQGPIALYQQNSNLNYWYTYSASNRLLYFKYNACIDSSLNPFASFAAGLLATLDHNAVDTLVFDVRGNGGGGSAVVAPRWWLLSLTD